MLPFLNATVKSYVRRYALSPVLVACNAFAYLIYGLLPKSIWALDRPVFIIGCPRSGTSVFVDLFSRHRELANWSEAGQVLQRRYYDAEADHLMEEGDVRDFDKARIKVFFRVFVFLSARPRFVNKNPRNSVRVRYLKALYPRALFVHLVRDGRAVVLSNMTLSRQDKFRRNLPFGGFCKPPDWRKHIENGSALMQFAHQWRGIIDYIQRVASDALTEADFLEITYENFCDHPHATLRRVDAFCGLRSELRDYASIPAKLQSENTKWRQTFNRSEIECMEKVFGTELDAYGYKRLSQ